MCVIGIVVFTCYFVFFLAVERKISMLLIDSKESVSVLALSLRRPSDQSHGSLVLGELTGNQYLRLCSSSWKGKHWNHGSSVHNSLQSGSKVVVIVTLSLTPETIPCPMAPPRTRSRSTDLSENKLVYILYFPPRVFQFGTINTSSRNSHLALYLLTRKLSKTVFVSKWRSFARVMASAPPIGISSRGPQQ